MLFFALPLKMSIIRCFKNDRFTIQKTEILLELSFLTKWLKCTDVWSSPDLAPKCNTVCNYFAKFSRTKSSDSELPYCVLKVWNTTQDWCKVNCPMIIMDPITLCFTLYKIMSYFPSKVVLGYK